MKKTLNSSKSSTVRIQPVHWLVGLAIAGLIGLYTINASSASVPVPGGGPLTKIYVATNGSDLNPGTPLKPVRSVKRAVDLNADIAVLMGKTYRLPMTAEHKNVGGIDLKKPLLVITDQTPWEHSPSSSKGGYTEVLPAVAANGRVVIDYRFLKFKSTTGSFSTIGSTVYPGVEAKFLKFQNTEFWGSGLQNVRYQGD